MRSWAARKAFNTRALVLRSYRLGEADSILVLLSRERGQIRAVARGARKTHSKFGGRLAVFNCVDVQIRESSSELKQLVEAQSVQAYAGSISADYERFVAGEVLVEFAQRFTEEVSSEQFFDLLHGAVAALPNPHHEPGQIVASFLLRALALEGTAPALESCATCGRELVLLPAQEALFSDAQGGLVCGDCALHGGYRIDGRVLAQLKALLDGQWSAVYAGEAGARKRAVDVCTRYAQWQLEHRLKALNFLDRDAALPRSDA